MLVRGILFPGCGRNWSRGLERQQRGSRVESANRRCAEAPEGGRNREGPKRAGSRRLYRCLLEQPQRGICDYLGGWPAGRFRNREISIVRLRCRERKDAVLGRRGRV